MKRLTGKYENGTAYYNIIPGESTIDRLAAIEDILGDEYDIKDIEKAFWCMNIVKDAFSDNPKITERLRKLWLADQKGHCVVFDEHYPVVSEYYRDEDGRYIREVSGVVSAEEYEAALKAREQDE